MATIYKRNNKYTASISYYDYSGKRKRKTKRGFKTKSEAREWALEEELYLKNNRGNFNAHVLLSDYMNNWINLYKTQVTQTTRSEYLNTVMNIKKYLPNSYLDAFTRQDFQEFINEFSKTYSKETVRKRKTHLTSLLREAYIEGKIKRDPTFKIINPSSEEKSKEENFLEFEDIKKLIQITSKNNIPSYMMV